MIEWQNNPPEEPMTWHNAVEYAKSLGEGWRLPTRSELIDACDNKIEGFEAIYYWSSSTYAQDTNRAWRLAFDDGGVGNNDKTISYYVRCVRDVKGKDVDPLKLDPSCIIIDRGELKMNKEEIQNKIDQLEKELNELKNKITDSTWEPYKNGYYIDSNGYCYEVEELCHKYPAPHNCFRTRGLAELRAKQREAEDELYNIWEHLVGNWRPDWSDNKNLKYCVQYHRGNGNIKVNANFSVSDRPLYRFFPTAELALRQYELASDHARAYIRGEF